MVPSAPQNGTVKTVRVAVDAMGGDLGPRPAVEGAIQAIRRFPNIEVILVGKERHLSRLLRALRFADMRLRVVHAPDVVTMNDSPRDSLRKRQSSLAIAAEMVGEGQADALVSVGNTGAVLAHSQLRWRLIEPIKKPGIATMMPTRTGTKTVMIDAGAAVDCKPRQLVNFAAMGACYAREMLGRANPTIAVMSIGEEDIKGNELSLATADLLRKTRLNFVGNAEGRDVFTGKFDVIVCDGFVGNVILKTAEGTAKFVTESLKEEARAQVTTMLGGLLLRPAVKALKKRVDYDESGGAPLLGVNGVAIIGHGSSGAKAYMNAIRVGAESAQRELPKRVAEWLEKTRVDLQAVGAEEPAG